jgi:hypothetical protein
MRLMYGRRSIVSAYHAYGAGAAWGKFVSPCTTAVTEAGVPDIQWPPPGSGDEAPRRG